MEAWHNVYIVAVIGLAPIVAAVLVWTRYRRAGGWLFSGAMMGSFVFGFYYHFVQAGADNVAQFSWEGWGAVFIVTAGLLAVVEGAGVGWGVWGLLGRRGVRETGKV